MDKSEEWIETVGKAIETFLARVIEIRDSLEKWREGLWKGNLKNSNLASNLELATAKLSYVIQSISSVDISSISDIEISFIHIKSNTKSRVLLVVCNILEAVILLLEDVGMFAEANLMDYVIDELRSFRMPIAFSKAKGGKIK